MYVRDWNFYFVVFYIVIISFPVIFCDAMTLLEFFLGPSLGRSSVKSKSLDITAAVSKTVIFFTLTILHTLLKNYNKNCRNFIFYYQ